MVLNFSFNDQNETNSSKTAAMATESAALPPLKNALMERVDSDRTDESPFGSTLTTPVDEDVILFHGIEKRLVGKSHVSHDDCDMEEGYTMIQKGSVDGHALLKSVDQDRIISIEDTTIQNTMTSLPTPEQSFVGVETQLPSSDSITRRRSRAQLTDVSISPLQDNLPSTTNENIVQEQESLGESGSTSEEQTPSGLEAIPEEPTLHGEKVYLPNSTSTDIDPLSQLTLEPNTDNGKPQQDRTKTAKDLLDLLPFAHQSPALDIARATDYPHLSPNSIFSLALRALIFLPWCVIAGTSILLFPQHLETIIFGPGFVASPEGIHRFAFWTEVSKELVTAFFAALIILWCWCPTIGLFAMGGTVARFLYTWKGFRLDRKISLGEDDMQSFYYVFKQYVSGNALVSMREEDDGFYL
ncbi:hypothetical protein C0989_010943 [Termitomyces sp. Mn162]|nr:hypothetical protein C0989_010943 [Termitomyces sp. Mn162]